MAFWLQNTNRPARIWAYGGDYKFYLNSLGQAQFVIYTNGGFRVIRSTASYDDGLWHQFVTTLSPAGAKLYVDGEVVALDSEPTTASAYSGSLALISVGVVGWPDTATNSFLLPYGSIVGTIDEIQLWTIERSQAEITQTMNRRLRGDEADLAGYWRFDEGAGEVTVDITGRGNRLVIYNYPRWVVSTVPLW